MMSMYVPLSPVSLPKNVNHPPAESKDAIDWPTNARPMERPRPIPAIRARALAMRGRGGRALRRGAREGRRFVSNDVFSCCGRVVTSVMVGRYGLIIRSTLRSG